MINNTVIKVEDVGKLYRLGEIGTGTLSHDLNRWFAKIRGKEDPFAKIGETNDRMVKGNSNWVWALKDINFEVKQGEVLGIIGRNGAGKSTLLKILSKVTTPSTGRIKTKGRIASLLEVGTGFHPELTGRENIFLNGAILGMNKAEIRSKFDEIVDFSGIERYIDTPVKRYSSGMYVRLAFAVAAHLEPEILIIDEVLAVGDAEFQKKCLGKMKDVSENNGRTVLFVSHNMGAVRTLCTNGLLIKQGGIEFYGGINEAVNLYEKNGAYQNSWSGIDGDEMVNITGVKICSEDGVSQLKNTSTLLVSIFLELKQDFKDLLIGFTIKSIYGNPIATVMYNDYNDYNGLKAGTYEIIFCIPPGCLAAGDYELNFNISIPFVKLISSEKINLSFNVIAESVWGNRYFVENNPNYNSIIRPNWFKQIREIK
jgi:lipopolysaccharide transport system ATP-binding protein